MRRKCAERLFPSDFAMQDRRWMRTSSVDRTVQSNTLVGGGCWWGAVGWWWGRGDRTTGGAGAGHGGAQRALGSDDILCGVFVLSGLERNLGWSDARVRRAGASEARVGILVARQDRGVVRRYAGMGTLRTRQRPGGDAAVTPTRMWVSQPPDRREVESQRQSQPTALRTRTTEVFGRGKWMCRMAGSGWSGRVGQSICA